MIYDRATLNADLDAEIMGETRTPPDYLTSSAVLQPVIDRLKADENWDLTLYNASGRTTTNLNQAVKAEFRRVWVIRVTREPEHQARLEELGEVAQGDNTYERVQTRLRTISIPALVPTIPNDRQSAITLNDPLFCLAALCRDCKRQGVRPPRERDI
jgi:hypothetical protein